MSCLDGCECEPNGYDRCEYRQLADVVVELFNPPDGESDEMSLCIEALTLAHAVLIDIPCTCTPDAIDRNVMDEPCRRCWGLGRRGDKREER